MLLPNASGTCFNPPPRPKRAGEHRAVKSRTGEARARRRCG
nr:MAG TPA: hypothetical protein [Caudoviricetes sp.]